MNISGTSTDVFAILAIAQANWPHDPVAGSEAVWRKWSEQLARYCFEEVATALDWLRAHPPEGPVPRRAPERAPSGASHYDHAHPQRLDYVPRGPAPVAACPP